jgi:putative phage-type endonuclease
MDKQTQTMILDAIAPHAISLPVAQEVDEKVWLEQRRKGIGGSDAGTVLGINPYQGPFELWLLKTNQIPDPDLSDREAVYWGHTLESIVCDEFGLRNGVPVMKPKVMFQSIERPWQQVSLDALTLDPETGEPAIFEAKTASEYLASEWADDSVPQHYEAQCYHAAAVTGIRNVWIGCLIGGQRFSGERGAGTRVTIDEEVLADVCAAEERFWHQHVLGGTQPPPDASTSCTDLLRAMWEAKEGEVELPPRGLDVAIGYLDAHRRLNAAKDEKAELGNWLRQEMAANTIGMVQGVQVATFNKQPDNRFDLETFKGDHPDLYEKYFKKGSTRALRVNPKLANMKES